MSVKRQLDKLIDEVPNAFVVLIDSEYEWRRLYDEFDKLGYTVRTKSHPYLNIYTYKMPTYYRGVLLMKDF